MQTLNEAVELRDSVFKGIKEIEKLHILASLNKESYEDVYIKV